MKPQDCIFRNYGNPNLPEVTLVSENNLYYLIDYSPPSFENDFISYAIDHEFSQAVQDRLKILTEEERALLAYDMIYAKETRNQTPIFCFENSTTKYDQSFFFVIDPTKYAGKKISHKDKVGDLFQEIYKGSERRPIFSNILITQIMMYRCKISNFQELGWLLDILGKQQGFLIKTGPDSAELTHKGYERFTEQTNMSSNKVFIAMQFNWERSNQVCDLVNNNDNQQYLNVVKEACEECGYKAEIVSEHHTNNITDQIIKEIRESRLVITDFTFNNRGAYYEAGYARALGKNVIHTLRKGHDLLTDDSAEFKRLHFDIAQINYILWEDFEKLKRDLINRIKALGY